MTVEHLTECPIHGEDGVQKLEFCAQHNGILDAFATQRGMDADAIESVRSTMLFGVVSFMGPTVFLQHNNCPVCVLEGTLERACDEVSMVGRKTN